MILPVYSRIGLRNVARNRRRSLLTIFAVAFGLFCLIVFLGLKSGLHQHMIANTMKLDVGAMQIHSAEYTTNKLSLQPLPDEATVIGALNQLGLDNYSRRLRTSALVLAGKNSSSIVLTGVEPSAEAKVTLISKNLVAGSYLEDQGTILLGETLAKSLGAQLGDTVKLMVWDIFGQQVVREFPVGGIFHSGHAALDGSHAFLQLSAAQKLLNIGDAVTGITVQVEPARVEPSVNELSALLSNERFRVSSWSDIAPDVRQLIDLNDTTMLLLSVIVFALVAMGIVNTMATSVYERFYEIGVLATIGTTPAGINGMILLESLFLGVAACLLGSLAGISSSLWLSWQGIDLTHWTSANQYFAGQHVLKSQLTLFDVVMSNLITLVTAFVAGIYPATKAAKLMPVDAIRHH